MLIPIFFIIFTIGVIGGIIYIIEIYLKAKEKKSVQSKYPMMGTKHDKPSYANSPPTKVTDHEAATSLKKYQAWQQIWDERERLELQKGKAKERAERGNINIKVEQQKREKEEPKGFDLYEIDTEYADLINRAYNLSPVTFSLKTIQNLSSNQDVWGKLKNGRAQLNTEEELLQYIYSYGNMHKAKLDDAFESLPLKDDFGLFDGESIEINDYGCGQGIGTVGFIDFMKSWPEFYYVVNRVRLIEPSLIALKRASLHVRYSLQSAEQQQVVHAINKELDDITENDLRSDKHYIKFHIFSNILDLDNFDLKALCDKIANSSGGLNYFFCVSPKIYSDGSHPLNQRLDQFLKYFKNTYRTTLISNNTSDIMYNRDKACTRYERVFKVNFDEPDDLPF